MARSVGLITVDVFSCHAALASTHPRTQIDGPSEGKKDVDLKMVVWW